MKLWQKEQSLDQRIEKFTVGRDLELDPILAPFDVLGTLAHIKMLQQVNLLNEEELEKLNAALIGIYHDIQKNGIEIQEGVEDIHSQVELMLTERLGDIGKKIHSARSRNDQVLVDIKMYLRDEIEQILLGVENLFEILMKLSEQHRNLLMPGYTHMQIAMPSSFGLWFGAYAESLKDDLLLLRAAFDMVNQNPLGSAAGFGSSFPIDRQLTTELLGFKSPNYNVVYAQMTRGKSERYVATAIAGLAATIGKMAMDICLYNGQNFNFFNFPEALTTGSSIMPHKKNPDVFELIRGRCNQLQSIPNELSMMLVNLPSGYHRELQLIKESIMPAIDNIKDCLAISSYMLEHMKVNERILEDPKYDYLFTVERVNELVLQGIPFRDAYKQVGAEVETGAYTANRAIKHTHLGSIGNLANEHIKKEFLTLKGQFDFATIHARIEQLLVPA